MSAPTPPSPRGRRVLAVLGTVLALVLALPWLSSLYVRLRWFRSLGFEEVFTTTLQTELVLGVAGALLLGALVYLNGRLASRFSEGGKPFVLQSGVEGQSHTVGFDGVAKRLPLLLAAVFAFFGGLATSAQWDTWLQYVHSSSFGVSDPIFGRDASFYVFTLPFLEALRSFLVGALAASTITAFAVYVLRGGVRFQLGRPEALRAARIHLSVLGALAFGILGFDRWLSMAELLQSDTGPVQGASYADVHATLPMLRAQVAVAAVAAVLVLVSATRKRLVLVGGAILLFSLVELVGVHLYPSTVQRFSVQPNEAVKEAPYIEHNIAATRFAYGLADVTERDLTGEHQLTAADLEANQGTIDNIRLWDHRPLLDTFAQIQEIRTYYEFASVDNDRYLIDGQLRQTMLSPRELNADSLPNQTWINERFTFTHGYGITLGPVNQATPEGLPVLWLQDIPPVDETEEMEVTRPEIYFGELSNDHVFVNTAAREFDRPSGDEQIYGAYDGAAGIRLDSWLTELAISTHLGSFKLLLSDDIDEESRVLLHRNIQERVRSVAPFLRYDRDPYMVVRDDGSLAWIQDAYTVTDRYPYAQPSFGTPARRFNYIRNSVKVVIDAFDGTVDFYVDDPEDPLVRTWRRIYPSLFRDVSEMPADLQRHLRHPEDLFRVQTEMFTVYHMDEPEDVYNREDQWEVPAMQQGGSTDAMEPYYTVMRLPEEDSEEFILMIPYTPASKQNLAAWMVARSDGEHRGELVVYRFPKDRLVFGPSQILNRINQDAEISRQVSLWDQRGSQALFGTLLVIPIEESLIYVAPLYLRSDGGRIPELKRVIAVYQSRIAMAETLDLAVADVFGLERAQAAAEAEAQAQADAEAQAQADAESTDTDPETAASVVAEDETQDLRLRAKTLFDRATAAQRRGDWSSYGEELRALGEVLGELAGAAGPPAEGTPDSNAPPSEPMAP